MEKTETGNRKTGKRVSMKFASIREFGLVVKDIVETAETPPHSVTRPNKLGYCAYSMDQSIDWCLNGWANGVELRGVLDAEARIKHQLSDDVSISLDWDVEGDFIDVGRVMEGTPEVFGYFADYAEPRRTVTVRVDVGVSCGVDESIIYNRGAAILALVDVLRSKNYHVVVQLVNCIEYDEHFRYRDYAFFRAEIVLDTSCEYSRDALAFCLANSGFLRRMLFALNESAFGASSLADYGYGFPRSSIEDDITRGRVTPDLIYFPELSVGPRSNSDIQAWETPKAAAAKVKSILEKQIEK